MKLHKIFIALFSAFLLTSPQVVVTSAVVEELAVVAEKNLAEVGAKEEGEVVSDAARAQAHQTAELDKRTEYFTQQARQGVEEGVRVVQQSAQEAEGAMNAVENAEANLADDVKSTETPGSRPSDAPGSPTDTDKPKGLTPEQRKAKIDDLTDQMKSMKSDMKSVAEDLRSSVSDLRDIDPAAEGNSKLTADQMKKKINTWIDDANISTEAKADLKAKLKNANFTKEDLFKEAKNTKKSIIEERINKFPDGDLKEALKKGNGDFFDKIDTGKDFSKMTPSELDSFANDGVNDAMKESRSKAHGYFKGELSKVGIFEAGNYGLLSSERFLKDGTLELQSLAEEGEQLGVGKRFKNKLQKFKESSVGQFLKHIGETLFSAVLFMIPNLIQSAITGGEQKKAEVLKWAQPIEFGGKVYQIPDECLHLESVNVLSQGAASYLSGNSHSSVPVYVQIPVSSVGETISDDIKTMFNKNISGPEESSDYYGANRYEINPAFYDMTDIVVSYGGIGSMTPTGGTILEGSEFGGQIISLTTGLVTDASGEIFNATGLSLVDGISQSPAVPLIPVLAWGNLTIPQTSPINQSLQSSHDIQPTILEKLVIGKVGSKTLNNQFDTSCLKANGGLNAPSCPSMIVQGLEEIQSGLDIQADGTVSFAEMTLPSDSTISIIGAKAGALTGLKQGTSSTSSSAFTIADPSSANTKSQKKFTLGRLSNGTSSWSGLGAVIPVFGWGSDPKTNKSTTIIPTSKGTVFDGFAFTPLTTGYADDDAVWAAQGCWIYLCANTPFILKLQEKFPGLRASLVGPITDYIVFMDENFNIVPLMSPENIKEQDSKGNTIWTKATFTVNPVIRYWTSLIFYNDDYMVQEISNQSQNPILFKLSDTKATPLAESSLGSMASQQANAQQGTPPGIIPTFLNNGGQSAAQAPYPISESFSRIYNQISAHTLALQYKVQQAEMQFNINGNNVTLKPSKYSINAPGDKGQTVSIAVYSGAKCFGVASEDDLLVALDGNNSPLQLPNTGVQFFVSLITDIVYQADTSGNFVYSTNSQSPLKVDPTNNQPVKNGSLYQIDENLEKTLNNLSQFVGAPDVLTITSTTKAYTSNKDIIKYVQDSRKAWLISIDDVVELGTGANSILCNLVSNTSDNCFIYELNETPSILYTTSDYFVVIDKASPTLNSLSKLQKLSPTSTSTVLVSLITGTLYNVVDGSAIQDKDGNSKRIIIPSDKYFSKQDTHRINTTADIIYEAITTQYKGLSKKFKDGYKQLVDGYNKQQAIPQGPYSFGKHKVAIRSIDNSMGNYIYFNAGDMTKAHVRPKNMYVILTKSGSGYKPDQYDKTKTQILLSLITGVAVDQQGSFAGKQPTASLASIIAQYSSVPFIAQNIKKLQSEYEEKQALVQEDIKQKDQDLKDLANDMNKVYTLDPKVAAIIKRLQPAGSGLVAPFVQLQQDPTTGDYVRISPTATSGELIYQFMDTGKVYDYSGRFVMQLSPGHLQAIRDQLGVIVDDKSGKQKLGIPQFQPSLRLTKKDASAVIGKTGEDMIAIGSADYPDKTVKMADGYGLFYNKSMDTYYVLDTKKNIWLSVDGGNVYDKNGAVVADDKAVAIFTGTRGTVYPLLVESNSAGYMQGFLSDGSEYANLSTSNKDMTWLGLSGDFNQYTVTTDAKSSKTTPTSYKINYGGNNTRTFTVNADYSWQDLSLVPIDKNGQLLKTIPNSLSQRMQLVKKGTDITFVIYNGSLYSVGKSSKGAITLQPFSTKDSNAVTGLKLATGLIDKDTNGSYIEITDGANVYKYGYMPKVFSDAQQEANRVNIIKGVTAAAPISLNVGPMKEVTVKVGDKNITTEKPTITTNVMFAADLPMKSNKVDAAKATIKDIANPVDVKENPKAYEKFIFDLQLTGSGLGNGVMKTSDGRFIYKLAAKTYTYVLEDAYVDFKNGSIYDAATGLSLGICLNIDDLISLLNTIGLVVNDKAMNAKGKDLNGENMLQYRGVIKKTSAPNNAKAQSKQ